MVLLSWIVVGAIAGWLSGQVLKGRRSGLRRAIMVGVTGGLIGGFLTVLVFQVPNAANGLNLTSTLVAFLGAVVLSIVFSRSQGRGHALRH